MTLDPLREPDATGAEASVWADAAVDLGRVEGNGVRGRARISRGRWGVIGVGIGCMAGYERLLCGIVGEMVGEMVLRVLDKRLHL